MPNPLDPLLRKMAREYIDDTDLSNHLRLFFEVPPGQSRPFRVAREAGSESLAAAAASSWRRGAEWRLAAPAAAARRCCEWRNRGSAGRSAGGPMRRRRGAADRAERSAAWKEWRRVQERRKWRSAASLRRSLRHGPP